MFSLSSFSNFCNEYHHNHFRNNYLIELTCTISLWPLSVSLKQYFKACVCSQMAVSHTTACGLWHGGVPVLRGSGVRLQLGRIGMLSCLHKLLSGRLWALISLHRQRLRSMTSSSLPSLWVCAVDSVVLPLTEGCPCAS